jgi:hypothetical protein
MPRASLQIQLSALKLAVCVTVQRNALLTVSCELSAVDGQILVLPLSLIYPLCT